MADEKGFVAGDEEKEEPGQGASKQGGEGDANPAQKTDTTGGAAAGDDGAASKGTGDTANNSGKRSGKSGEKKGAKKLDTERNYNIGMKVELGFLTQHTGKSVVGSDLEKGALDIKGDALSSVEEGQGYGRIIKASPTNLDYGKDFIDGQNVLAANLNMENQPNTFNEMTGCLKRINSREELICLFPLPQTRTTKPIYMKNSVVKDNTVTVQADSQAATSGQFMGMYVWLKQKKITKVQLVDMTPDQFDKISVEGRTVKTVSSPAYYRAPRESRKAFNNMTVFENKRGEGVKHNPIFNAPDSQTILIMLMDIVRDTTMTLEKAIICGSQFLASVNQDRYYYGQDVSRRFTSMLGKVKAVLDLNGDGKKFNKTADLINKPFLVNILDDAIKTFSSFKGLYCYPRTTIAVKRHLQELFKWTKKSNDHRGIPERCVNAFTTNFLYSTVTTVDGVSKLEVTSGEGESAVTEVKIDNTKLGIGGESSRVYMSMNNGNPMPLSISHPIFDGIQDMLQSKADLSTNHPWNNSKSEAKVPLTFDPEYPMFAFLILRSMGEILNRLQNTCIDLYNYLDDGGSLCETFVKYPVSSLESFLKEAGYDKDARHNSKVGMTVTVTDNGNLRARYPETLRLIQEGNSSGTDGATKHLCEYHPGLITADTVQIIDDEYTFTGRFGFPSGQAKVEANQLLNSLDPVILINNAKFKPSVKFEATEKNSTGAHTFKMPEWTMDTVTVNDWIKARRILGLIYSVPSCLMPFNADLIPEKDGTSAGITDDNIKALLATELLAQDFGKFHAQATDGVQVSTVRLSFPIYVDEFKKVKVTISNLSGKEANLKATVAASVNVGNYVETEGFLRRVIKGTTAGQVTCMITPSRLVNFPFGNGDLLVADAPYLAVDKWGYHAKFFRSYTNPFLRIMEVDKLGAEDGATKLVPHQLMVNDVYYFIALQSDERMQKCIAAMDANLDYIESALYSLR